MHRVLIGLFSLVLVIGAAAPLRAQDALEEIVVSATRRAESVQTVPASVSRIDADRAADRGALFIGEGLIGLPGVRVDRPESGTQTALTIRGVPNRINNDTFVAFLDGVPFVTPDDESDLEEIPALARDRAEVLRGPSSALYGRGATAGTVHFRSPAVPEGWGGGARTRIGSDGFRRVGAELSAPLGGAGAALLRARYETGNGWRDRTDREEDSLFFKHRWQPAAGLTLTTSLFRTDQAQGIAGPLPTDRQGQRVPLAGGRSANFDQPGARFDRRLIGGTVRLAAALNERLDSRTIVHSRHADSLAVEGFLQPFQRGDETISFTGFRVDADDRFWFASQQFTWSADHYDLIVGGAHEQVRGHRFETFRGLFGFGGPFFAVQRDIATGAIVRPGDFIQDRLLDVRSQHRNSGAYGQGRWRWRGLEATLGLRWDRFERQAHYAPTRSPFGIDPGAFVADSETQISVRAALGYVLTADLNAYVSFGQGFSPAFGPLFSFRGRDPSLDPETSRQVEIGLKGRLWRDRFAFALAGYELQRRDLLQLLPQGPTAVTLNAGAHRVRGFELSADADLAVLWAGLGLRLNYAYTASLWLDNRFIDPAGGGFFDFSGNRVAGVSPHSGSLEIRQSIPAYGLDLLGFWELASGYPVANSGGQRGGGFALFTATAEWAPPWIDGVRLSLTARNLFDATPDRFVFDAQGPFGVAPLPPRQVFLSLNFHSGAK